MFTPTCVCPGERHHHDPRDVLRAERPPHTHPEGQENRAEEPLQRRNQSALRQDQDVSTDRAGETRSWRKPAECDVISQTHPLCK